MEIDIQPVDGISVATIVGDIDGSNAAAAQSRILALAQSSGKFVLDMSKVGYMSSAGLRALVFAKQKMGASTTIYVVGAQESVMETIEMTGFSHSVTLLETYDAAQIEVA